MREQGHSESNGNRVKKYPHTSPLSYETGSNQDGWK